MNTLYIMIGIPGSGKSTKAFEMSGEDTVVISSDGIRKELTGSEEHVPELCSRVFSILEERVRENIRTRNVVVDATNIHVKDWRKYFSLCPDGTSKVAYLFDVPPDVALKRMEQRERKVPPEVVASMWQALSSNMGKVHEMFDRVEIMH